MPKTIKYPVMALILILGLAISLITSCTIKTLNSQDTEENNETTGENIIRDPELGLELFQEAWERILEEYVEKDSLDTSKLSEAAINGMLDAINDPYTSYLPARDYGVRLSDIEGKFEGIGAYLGFNEAEQVIIIAPLNDSPADRAGIKPGDRIMEIDGVSAVDMSIDEVVLLVRGPKGTPVNLLILHEDEAEPVVITIIRDVIKLTSAYWEMREDNIAYLHIMSFTERTNDELGPLLEEMDDEGAEGIVLDLRSNPGGLLSSVVDVSSRFLKSGIILYTEDSEGNRLSELVNPRGRKTDLPLVILTDNYTASASEVLAGAMQDHDRAVVAGTTTFGKGSVQTLFTLKDGSGLKITSARWLTPDGRQINGLGIEPDYKIDKEEDIVQWAIDFLKNGAR